MKKDTWIGIAGAVGALWVLGTLFGGPPSEEDAIAVLSNGTFEFYDNGKAYDFSTKSCFSTGTGTVIVRFDETASNCQISYNDGSGGNEVVVKTVGKDSIDFDCGNYEFNIKNTNDKNIMIWEYTAFTESNGKCSQGAIYYANRVK